MKCPYRKITIDNGYNEIIEEFAECYKGEWTMTDKQKLLEWINTYCNDDMTIEDIVDSYIGWHEKELSAYRLNDLLRRINSHLICAISDMDRAVRVAHERATYLKCYLEGNMYTNEEVARQCVDLQIENAKAILDSTERVAL